jgi:hypothetical protein
MLAEKFQTDSIVKKMNLYQEKSRRYNSGRVCVAVGGCCEMIKASKKLWAQVHPL